MSRLPVDPDRCEHRRIEYSARDWDQTPRVVTIREIDRLMPDISRLAANEITAKADINVIRTVHFNIMAEKDFLNPDFERLCQFIADFIELRIADRQIRDAAQGLEESISAAVALHSVSMIEKYKELDDIIQDSRDRGFIRATDVNLGRFHDIVRAIDDMQNEDQRDIRTADRDDRRYNNDRGRSDRRSRDDRYDQRDRYSHDEPVTRYNRDERYGSRNTRSRDDREYDDRRGGRSGHFDERYGRRREVPVTEVDRNSEVVVVEDFPGMSQNTRASIHEERFERNHEERAQRETVSRYNPRDYVNATHEETAEQIVREHKLVKQEEEKDPNLFYGIHGTIPFLIPPGKSEMDIIKHSSIYSNDPEKAEAMAKEVARVLTLGQAVNADDVTTESIEKDIVVETDVKLFSNTANMTQFLANQATVKAIEASGENTDGRRQVLHTVAVVDNSIIGYRHLNDLQANLSECKDLRSIISFLKRAKESVDKHATAEAAFATDLRAAVDHFDAIITKEINSFCRDVLRISDGNAISSAIEQLDALINADAITSNPNLHSAIIGHLTNMAINVTEGWDPENSIAAAVKEEAESNGENIGAAFYPQVFNVTYVPFTVKELGYDLRKPVAIQNSDISSFLRAVLNINGTEIGDEKVLAGGYRIMITRDRQAFRIYNYPGRRDVMILAPQTY